MIKTNRLKFDWKQGNKWGINIILWLFLVYLWDSLGIEKAISLWVLLRNLDKNDSSSSDEERSSQNPSAFPSSSLDEEHEESLCLGIFKAENGKSLDFSS